MIWLKANLVSEVVNINPQHLSAEPWAPRWWVPVGDLTTRTMIFRRCHVCVENVEGVLVRIFHIGSADSWTHTSVTWVTQHECVQDVPWEPRRFCREFHGCQLKWIPTRPGTKRIHCRGPKITTPKVKISDRTLRWSPNGQAHSCLSLLATWHFRKRYGCPTFGTENDIPSDNLVILEHYYLYG